MDGDCFFLRRLPVSSVSSALAISGMDTMEGITDCGDVSVVSVGDVIMSSVIVDIDITEGGDVI